MSGTPPSFSPPQGSSRSSSPSGPTEKPRAVSSSLKDRIAKFNNLTAAPLIPTHAFGTAGPAQTAAPAAPGGLVGNRLPTLDPKTAGVVGGQRRTSENKGLIGNRIPSIGNVSKPTGGRSASPAGSGDSSVASAAAGSTSPVTSRSSSPPTSPGGNLPLSLLSATLPDDGGPGAATPSSTRAEAGEETSELSIPSTPIVGSYTEFAPDTASPQYDLVPSNLKLAAAEQMQHSLSAQSGPRSFAPSISSSLGAQYDPSSRGSESQYTMMNDVSGISTPMGTPRAARRDLEGSARGEGSVAGDVAGEGDMEDLGNRLEGLGVDARDRESTPGPLKYEEGGKNLHLESSMEAESQQIATLRQDEGQEAEVREATPAGTQQWSEAMYGRKDEAGKHDEATREVGPEVGQGNQTKGEDETTPPAQGEGLSTVFGVAVDDPPTVKEDMIGSGALPPPGFTGENAEHNLAQKPVQVHIEPAPVAQPASSTDPALESSSLLDFIDNEGWSSSNAPPPTFPSAPIDDPDIPSPFDTKDPSRSATPIPIDSTHLKSFPDVPDEEKPRVQVHVPSSPINTPQKARSSSNVPDTPLADLPGHSKSLGRSPPADQETPRNAGSEKVSPEEDATPPRRDTS